MTTQQGMYGLTPKGSTDPDGWLAELDDVRRPQLEELDDRIRSLAPGVRRYVDRGFLRVRASIAADGQTIST